MADETLVTLSVNGESHSLLVPAKQNLLQTLRHNLGLTGAKCGCEHGVCGACTVTIDGHTSLACLALTLAQSGRDIRTIEGLAEDETSAVLIEAFVEHGALQCGFCTPGMIASARVLLQRKPVPTVADIRQELGGNICRCTGYVKIVDAVLAASKTAVS